MEERELREGAVRDARRRAEEALARWRAEPRSSLRRERENEARVALSDLAEALRRLEDLAAWRDSPDETPPAGRIERSG